MKESFYGKLYAQGYEIGTDPSEIVRFYLGQWERFGRPGPVLEPMCGTGLNLISFLKAGAVCDGLDSSPYMLAICRSKMAESGLDCSLYEQNLEALELPRRYGFMMIPGGSFGHLYDRTAAANCLYRLREHLLPGGWLVFDVRPPAYMSQFGGNGLVDYDLVEYPDGSSVFITGLWQHLEDGTLIRKWNKLERFVNGQLTETEVFDYRERLYELSDLQALLKTAGFDKIHVTRAYDLNVQPGGKDGIVFMCRRS